MHELWLHWAYLPKHIKAAAVLTFGVMSLLGIGLLEHWLANKLREDEETSTFIRNDDFEEDPPKPTDYGTGRMGGHW